MGTFYLLPKEGTFYKANLHCHTVVSDGDLTPEQVKDEIKGVVGSIYGAGLFYCCFYGSQQILQA